jgi:hypothetical protein
MMACIKCETYMEDDGFFCEDCERDGFCDECLLTHDCYEDYDRDDVDGDEYD